MFNLILSILCSTVIVLIFRAFGRYQIQTLQAIVVNYLVCVAVGSLALGYFPMNAGTIQQSWFPMAIVLGCLFISGFYLVALTVKYYGVGLTSVLQKMSLLLSVPFAIWFYSEPLNVYKVLGVVLALAAVVLVNLQSADEKALRQSHPAWTYILPIQAFVIGGIIECGLQYVEKSLLAPEGKSADMSFLVSLFGTAGVIGICILLVQFATGKAKPQLKSLLAGVVLGVPNFGSIYFLLLAIGTWGGSVVLPVNNVAIILLSALIAWFVLHEKMSKTNLLGMLLAAISIVVVALGG